MGNSLRCALACVLPCGALDLIRIVHLNGNVEELTGPITAGEVLNNNPNHVLSKPSSQGVVRKILILSPTTELKKGSIYFLIPASSLPENKRSLKNSSAKKAPKKVKKIKANLTTSSSDCDDQCPSDDVEKSEKSEKSEKKSGSKHHRRRSSSGTKVGVWKPHLESIVEDL